MTFAEIRSYLAAEFPQVFEGGLSIETASEGEATIVLVPGEKHLRPGDIVSGPTLMTLADASAYAALLSLTEAAKMAVTSNLNITFLRAAPPGATIAQSAKVLKLGRRLAVLTCEASQPGGPLIAHATLSYAMPATKTSVVI